MTIAKIARLIAALVVSIASTPFIASALAEPAVAGTSVEDESGSPGREGLPNLFQVPCGQAGVVEFLGVAKRPGVQSASGTPFELEIDGKKYPYRPLRVGDLVEAGEVIGRLDDAQARAEVRIKQGKVSAAETEKSAATKTKEQAYKQWKDLIRLAKTMICFGSLEPLRASELTYYRHLFEEEARAAAVNLAKEELAQARTVLDSYLVRSTARGIVRRILKHPGEAVRKLETIVTLQLLDEESE